MSGRLFSASGGYVGEFSPVAESLVAFRDVTASGAWPPDALAEAMHRHLRLSLRNAAPVEQRPPRADVITGHCLCEGVQFELREVVGPLELCHCPRCRRVSGSAFFAGLVVATDGYRMTAGRELVQSFALPVRERPPPYTTFFCMRCGSPVPHPEPEGETFELPAGLLEHDPGVSADRHIFIEHRAPWFDPNTALPEFDLAALIRLRFGRREADEPER